MLTSASGPGRLGHPAKNAVIRARSAWTSLRHDRHRTRRHEDQLPDTLEPLLGRIEKSIPAGVARVTTGLPATLSAGLRRTNRNRACGGPHRKVLKQFGTLGSGNHFLRCASTSGPGMGRAALRQPRHRQPAGPRPHRQGPPTRQGSRAAARGPDLAYFPGGHPEFDAYIGDMCWPRLRPCNRDQMMDNAMREVFTFLGFGRETQRINCHHNFTQREFHGSAEL